MRMWKLALFYIVVVMISAPQPSICNCEGEKTTLQISKGNITSPNYPREYGEKAFCNWHLTPPSGEEYAVKLNLKSLGLYFVIDKKKQCSGSYNLSINNRRVNCSRRIKNSPTPNPPCKFFYNAKACANLEDARECNTVKRIDFPLNITYESDGRTNKANSGPLLLVGFDFRYKFINCNPENTKDKRRTASPTTTTTFPNTVTLTAVEKLLTTSTVATTTLSTTKSTMKVSTETGNDLSKTEEPLHSLEKTTKNVTKLSGCIISPHGFNEYGKSADNEWRLSPPSDGKIYFLQLKFKHLKLYFMDGPRYCSGSYNLTIHGVDIECKSYADPMKYYVFYSTRMCARNTQALRGKQVNKASFPVRVVYHSSGATKKNRKEEPSMGFEIEYKFLECTNKETRTQFPTPSTTFYPSKTTSTFKPISKHNASTVQAQTSARKIASRKKPDETRTAGNSTKYNKNSDERSSSAITNPTTLISIIVPASASLLFILAIVAFVWFRTRTQKNFRARSLSRHELTAMSSPVRSNSQSDHSTVVVRTSNPDSQSQAPVYWTIDAPNHFQPDALSDSASVTYGNQQAELSMYASIDSIEQCGQSHSAPNHSEQNVDQSQGIVYSTVDTSVKGKKGTSRYNKSTVDNVLYSSTK